MWYYNNRVNSNNNYNIYNNDNIKLEGCNARRNAMSNGEREKKVVVDASEREEKFITRSFL